MALLPFAIAAALPLHLLLLLLSTPASGLKCYRTEVGFTPHLRDCGPHAKACRVLIHPYKAQNYTAVASCEFAKREPGGYIYDCGVECPAKDKWDWNEINCCSTEECNDGTALTVDKRCFISKADGSIEDSVAICNPPKKCGVNTQTGDTDCVDVSVCSSGTWWCCTDAICKATWGVFKPAKPVDMEESTDAVNLKASLSLSIVSLLLFSAVR